MNSVVKKSVVLGLLAGLMGLGGLQALHAQQKSSFKVGGPCMACGASRMESLVKGIDGVNSATFDAAKGLLAVDFNPTTASLLDIQLELSINGYDAGEFLHDVKAKLPPCAGSGMRGDQAMDSDIEEPGIDDIEGLEPDDDWENPDLLDVDGDDDDVDLLLNDDEDDDSDLDMGDDDEPADPDMDGDEDDDDDDL